MTPKVGFVKLGNIGTSLVAHLLLDERADRDIDVRVINTGAKLGEGEAENAKKQMTELDLDLVIIGSPNAALPGPRSVREAVDKPCMVISDGPAKKIVDELREKGFGYIIMPCDPLIGARREFLDPTEMVIFNTDVLRTLAAIGAIRLMQEEIDKAIESISKGGQPYLPQVIATAEDVVEAGGFTNPYARAKAITAYNMAEKVADMNVQACFVLKEPEKYIQVAAAAHELIREAAKLAEGAREIEKGLDSVSRTPHAKTGEILRKMGLMERL